MPPRWETASFGQIGVGVQGALDAGPSRIKAFYKVYF